MFRSARVEPDPIQAPAPEAAVALLGRLCDGESLGVGDTAALFTALVEGNLHEAQIAALLVALKVKGETADELVGAAGALIAAAAPFPRPAYLFADSCGTGGDGASTINVSTAVAFVAAAAGLPVAKHGNRSVTSRCGSADVLEQLGVRLEASAETSRRALDEAGICFLYAPQYHPGLRHAGPVRRALKVRTVMNMLGPCVNPARPAVQLLGVADPNLLEPVAATLAGLGVERALVVHGAGLDEVALHGDTDAVQLADGALTRLTLRPEDAGLAPAPLAALRGGDPLENAARLADVLRGRGNAVEIAAVALNAGALLMTAGLAPDLRAGAELARDTLASGEPHRRLEQLAAITHG